MGESEEAAPPRRRDAWDKASILLHPVGGLLTALAVAGLGFWTSSYLREREAREAALRERMQTGETNARLYSELISKREESESALRKDMFTSIITSFLGGGAGNLEQKVLNLELLVYNFHESLNLKPLFLHLARLVRDSPQKAEYMRRLNRVAEEVAQKQMLVIEEGGAVFDASVDGKALALVGPDGESEVPFVARDLVVDGVARNFKLEVLGFDRANEQVQLRVTVRTRGADGRRDDLDRVLARPLRLPDDRQHAPAARPAPGRRPQQLRRSGRPART